jgi:hypothetical protein
MADAIVWCLSHPRVVMLVLFLIIAILGTMGTERGHQYTREDRSYRAFVVRWVVAAVVLGGFVILVRLLVELL